MYYTYNRGLSLTDETIDETIPCYYQTLDRMTQVKGHADNLKEIALLTAELNAATSKISLHDLSMKLYSLSINIPDTALSNSEKAVLQDCETNVKKVADRFQTTQGTSILSRIYGLWLCLYNWWSGNDVYLKQIKISLIGFSPCRQIMPASNDPQAIRLHATNMLIRWMIQQEFSLHHMEPLRENQTIEDLFVFSAPAQNEKNTNLKDKDIVACAKSIAEIWRIARFGNENFQKHIANMSQFALSDKECSQILGIATP